MVPVLRNNSVLCVITTLVQWALSKLASLGFSLVSILFHEKTRSSASKYPSLMKPFHFALLDFSMNPLFFYETIHLVLLQLASSKFDYFKALNGSGICLTKQLISSVLLNSGPIGSHRTWTICKVVHVSVIFLRNNSFALFHQNPSPIGSLKV